MPTVTFYFSRVEGNNVYSNDDKIIGKIRDIAVETGKERPKIVAAKLKSANEEKIVDFANFNIEKQEGQYRLVCSEIKEIELNVQKTYFIRKHVIDKQIIDMNGKKLERIKDVRFAMFNNDAFLIAVDVGLEGTLRRIGLAKPLKKILKPFGLAIPSNLILWENVETIDVENKGLKLSKNYANLARLHPSDLADIIEDLDKETQIELFKSLDVEKAADVLEELETDAQVSIIESLEKEKAADVLEAMPADEAADVLDELHEDKAEELLNEMENESSEEIRDIMEYDGNTVGSIMATEYMCFSEKNTVSDVIAELRRSKPEADTIYYIYIIDDNGRLKATVTIRDLIVSEPDTKLGEIMDSDVVFVHDKDNIDSVNDIIAKYNLLALPVADIDEKLVGVVIINDVMLNLLKTRKLRIG